MSFKMTTISEKNLKISGHSHQPWSHMPIVLVVLIFIVPRFGWPYEARLGFTGTRLDGTVTIQGKIPSPQRYNLVLFSDPYYCGRISDGQGWRLGPYLAMGNQKLLPGAVVFLEDVETGKLGTTSDTIIQTKNCVFLPYVSVTQIGHTFHFQNWDPIQHNLEVNLTSPEGAETLLEEKLHPHPENRKSDFLSEKQVGLHRSGPEVEFRPIMPGILALHCRLHDYMTGWALVFSHPYFSVTGENGEFALEDVPPGDYTLVAWHPFGRKAVPITVGTQNRQNTNIIITLPSHTTHPEEGSANNPFGIDLIGDSSIVPTLELQEWDSNQLRSIGDPS